MESLKLRVILQPWLLPALKAAVHVGAKCKAENEQPITEWL